jgi:hypothetical protein
MIISVVTPDALERISRLYGPSGALQRAYYRFTIKCWVNARNPVWAYRKFSPLAPVDDLDRQPRDVEALNGRKAA